MRKLKLLSKALVVGALSLGAISCSSSSSGGNGPGPGPIPQASRLQVGNIGALPTNKEALGGSYPLMVYNNTTAVINITSVKSSGVDPRLGVTSDSQLFDYGSCKSGIPVGGSCAINVKAAALQVNGVGDNGQYGLVIDGVSTKGTAYHNDQVISYQNMSSKAATGAHYNVSGATTTNITQTTQMGVTVPVYFDKAYTNVKVNAGAVDATLLGCGLIQPNGTYNISANSSCSVYVNFRGGKSISTTVSLVAGSSVQSTAKTGKSTKSLSSKSLQDGGSQIMSFGMLNSTQAVAYITTGLVTSSLPSNGTTTQTITFVNNGMSNATGMGLYVYDPVNLPNGLALNTSVTIGSDTLTVTANTCSGQAGGTGNGTLAPTASCAITFTMAGTSQVGTVQMLMNYSTGAGTSTSSYSTYYYPVNNIAGLSSSAAPSATTFLNTVVGGVTKSMTVTVTNTSTTVPVVLSTIANMQSILVTNGSPSVPTGMTVTANTCTSGLSLAAGVSCAYTVEYTASVATSGQINNLFGLVKGTYQNQNQTFNVSSALNMPYSASDPTELTFNPTALQFTTNVNESVDVPLVITNTTSGQVTNITFDFANINLSGVTITSQSPSNCLILLPGGDTCSIVMHFAPTTAESSNGYQSLNVSYSGATVNADVIPTSFEAILGNTNVQVTNVVASDVNSPPVGYTGVGTSVSPYTFYNYGGSFSLQVTYQNIGTVTADNFTIDGSTLPSVGNGLTVDTGNTTCGLNGATVNLAPNASCILAFTGVNPNYQSGLTYSGALDFAFPNAVYFESGQQLIRNVWSYNGSNEVYISANQIASPSFSIANNSGVIESIAGVQYFVYPVTLANNANAGQTAPINVGIDVSAFSTSTLAGFGTDNTIPPSSSNAYTAALAGGESVSSLYLFIPTNTITSLSTFINSGWTYTGITQPTNVSDAPGNAAVGVFYSAVANSGAITAQWSTTSAASSNITPYANLFSIAGLGATVPSGNVIDLQQYQGYLYAATTTGVYSYQITLWVTTGSTSIPDATATTGTGGLTVVGGNQVSAITAPGAFALNSVSGTNYALTTASGAQTTNWPYDLSTVVNGAFTNAAGNFTGLVDTSSILSVAVSSSGNIYLTTSGNAAYYCGSVTAVAGCTALSLPSAITTAASNSTLSYLTVIASGGNIVVTQYVIDPSSAGNFVPTTRYIYAADAGASTALSSATTQTISSFITGLPYTYFYNMNTANSATQLFGLSGQSVSASFSSPYTHSYNAGGYAANLATPTFYGSSASGVAAANAAYYSFLTIGGQN